MFRLIAYKQAYEKPVDFSVFSKFLTLKLIWTIINKKVCLNFKILLTNTAVADRLSVNK